MRVPSVELLSASMDRELLRSHNRGYTEGRQDAFKHKTPDVDMAEVRRVLRPICKEIREKGDNRGFRETNWNPDAHVEITLTIRECREVLKLMKRRSA